MYSPSVLWLLQVNFMNSRAETDVHSKAVKLSLWSVIYTVDTGNKWSKYLLPGLSNVRQASSQQRVDYCIWSHSHILAFNNNTGQFAVFILLFQNCLNCFSFSSRYLFLGILFSVVVLSLYISFFIVIFPFSFSQELKSMWFINFITYLFSFYA